MIKKIDGNRSPLKNYLSTFSLVSSGYSRFLINFLFISALFLIVAAITSYTPFLLRQAANEIGKEAKSGFYLYALAYASCWTLASVLQNVKGIFSAGVLARSDAALHKILMKHVLSYSSALQKSINPGVVAQDISRAAVSFGAVTTALFWTIGPIFFEFLISMGIIYRTIGGSFAGLFGVCIAVLGFVSYVIASKSGDIHLTIYRAQNKVQGFVVERLSALFDIRINDATIREKELLDRHLDETAQVIWRSNLRVGLYLGCQALAIGVALGLFTVYSVKLNNSANFTNGDFVMIAGYVGMLTAQLRFLSGALIELKRHQIALDLGIKYINPKEFSNPEDITPEVTMRKKEDAVFSLHDVSIAVSGRLLFSNISHDFYENRFVAIVAPSGFGKTTLINAMLGLFPVADGRIEFYGAKVTADSTFDVLKVISIAPQATHIFNDSLRFNLGYGCSELPSDDKLRELLVALSYLEDSPDAGQLIDLDEKLGIGGRALSGGERQRLSIGRAMLRGKRVLILDEPTAFLNRELAQKIIRYVSRNVTTLIVITHDEDVVAMADEVLRLAP